MERQSHGPRVAEIADVLGTPLMPWQRYVADVALEINPESGRLHYRTVVITVPRQSGKTTLLLSLMVHRALSFGPRQNIIYTAQTQLAAKKKFEEDHIPILEASPMAPYFKARYTNGSEQVKWKNGSRHTLTPPTEKAGHGETIDFACLDEAFAQTDDRVEQALRPAMITRSEPQFYIISTAGTAKSLYLKGKVELGRTLVREDIDSKVAYFEWSAPDDSDPANPETWKACMPALGYTIDIEAIRSEHADMKLPEFRRAYLNQWSDQIPELWLVVSEQDWHDSLNLKSQIREDSPLSLGVDFTPERSFGTLVVAGINQDDRIHVEIPSDETKGIYDHAPGISWIVPHVVEFYHRWKPVVVIQQNSPAASLIPELEAKKVKVTVPSSAEYVGACGNIFDRIYSRGLAHTGQSPFVTALAGAHKLDLGEGAWKWNRKAVTVDISPLVAMTLAVWGLSKNRETIPWASWVELGVRASS
jgi:hypothetical protein